MTLFDLIGVTQTLQKNRTQKIELHYTEITPYGLATKIEIGYLNDEFDNYAMDKLIEDLGDSLIERIYVSPFYNTLVIELDGYNKAINTEFEVEISETDIEEY